MTLLEERLKTHHESLSRAILFTTVADRKAAPVLAVQVALLGTLAARFDSLTPHLTMAPVDAWDVVILFAIATYVISLILVVIAGASVYFPITPRTGSSLLYFEDVAEIHLESFTDRAMQMDSGEIERQLLQQIHTVSRIASLKMRRVRWSLLLSVPAVCSWALLIAGGSL